MCCPKLVNHPFLLHFIGVIKTQLMYNLIIVTPMEPNFFHIMTLIKGGRRETEKRGTPRIFYILVFTPSVG